VSDAVTGVDDSVRAESRSRRIAFGLPRDVWLVQCGVFVNALGWGAVLPFEVIYLHSGRGFALSTAGLIVGLLSAGAMCVAPVAGVAIDHVGARRVAAAAGLALAAGYAGLALAQTAPLALVAAAVAGAGNGALQPAQSALLAAIAPADRHHRAAAVARTSTNAGFGVGALLGGIVAAYGLTGFVALLLLNALSYLVYVAVLVTVIRQPAAATARTGALRVLLRDHALRRLAATNGIVIAVGWGVLPAVVPPYARQALGAGTGQIGLLLVVNAATVVLAQVPIARRAEGRRRTSMMALGAIIIAVACVAFLASSRLGYAALLLAAVMVGIGECCHSAALMPLAADLAPPGLSGRYIATIWLSWWAGLALAPILGTRLLDVSAAATFLVAAGSAALAAGSMLALDRRLPPSARWTPCPAAVDSGRGGEDDRG
jgi:MFS family permease